MGKITKIFLFFLCTSVLAGVLSVQDSRSFFSDSVKITGNIISTGFWDTDDPDKPGFGDVIINEVHWAGSPADGKDHDQWIELYNTTDEDISLKNWMIENAGVPPKGLRITGNPTIKAHGYLLITRRVPRSAESALIAPTDVQNASLYLDREEYKKLILKDAEGNIVDETPDNSPWPAGEYEEGERYFSMQRNADNNWQTCNPDDFNLTLYWKPDYLEYVCGTPGASNLPNNNINIQNLNIDSQSNHNEDPLPKAEVEGLSDDKTEEPVDKEKNEEAGVEKEEDNEDGEETEKKDESENDEKENPLTVENEGASAGNEDSGDTQSKNLQESAGEDEVIDRESEEEESEDESESEEESEPEAQDE